MKDSFTLMELFDAYLDFKLGFINHNLHKAHNLLLTFSNKDDTLAHLQTCFSISLNTTPSKLQSPCPTSLIQLIYLHAFNDPHFDNTAALNKNMTELIFSRTSTENKMNVHNIAWNCAPSEI